MRLWVKAVGVLLCAAVYVACGYLEAQGRATLATVISAAAVGCALVLLVLPGRRG